MVHFISFSVAIFAVVLCATEAQRYKLNQRCKLKNTGVRGICLLPTNCPQIQAETERGIQPTKCGDYAPNVPIVCCPGGNPATNIIATPNENTLLNVPDGIVYPEDGDNNNGNGIGKITNQKCREYLPTEEYAFIGLALGGTSTKFNVTKCPKGGIPLIVGGTAADPGEFPFMAAIGWNTQNGIEYKCGGTLISRQYVLTAAHCTYARGLGTPNVVRLGDLDLDSSDDDGYAVNYNIVDIKSHDGYTGSTHYNDIALMKLERKITYFNNRVRPVCLWTRSNFDTTNAITMGWGHKQEAGERSSNLLKVTLRLHSKDICQRRYNNIKKLPNGITDEMICSGYLEGGRDSCQGDSGGPLISKKIDGSCEYYLIGVTSFGLGCAKANTPGLYTRVSSYLEWIEKIVWN